VLCGIKQYSIRPKRSAVRAQVVYFLHSTMPSVACMPAKSCVIYLTKKQTKFRLSQTVASARIAPKICQGQPPTMCSQCAYADTAFHRLWDDKMRISFGISSNSKWRWWMRVVAAFCGALIVQVGWLGLGLAASRRLVCIHQMNWVNSRNY